jgi:hypothetical protein
MSEKIILLKDFYDLKEQKEKELKFYREKMRELEENLFWVEKELNLTKRIINMIEQDKITKI